MKVGEAPQNLSLAVDMIYFLTKIIVYEHPNKIDMITDLVEKWDARVTQSLRKIKVEEAHKMAEHSDDSADVASIMISIDQQHGLLIKDEFKQLMKSLLIQTMMEETDEIDVGP